MIDSVLVEFSNVNEVNEKTWRPHGYLPRPFDPNPSVILDDSLQLLSKLHPHSALNCFSNVLKKLIPSPFCSIDIRTETGALSWGFVGCLIAFTLLALQCRAVLRLFVDCIGVLWSLHLCYVQQYAVNLTNSGFVTPESRFICGQVWQYCRIPPYQTIETLFQSHTVQFNNAYYVFTYLFVRISCFWNLRLSVAWPWLLGLLIILVFHQLV